MADNSTVAIRSGNAELLFLIGIILKHLSEYMTGYFFSTVRQIVTNDIVSQLNLGPSQLVDPMDVLKRCFVFSDRLGK